MSGACKSSIQGIGYTSTPIEHYRTSLTVSALSMVDAGFEMTTKATGKQNTVLHIKYALTGRVTSNAIGKGLDFAQLRELGFKKVVMTNGFADELEETYTWTVQ